MTLHELGYNDALARHFDNEGHNAAGRFPARVAEVNGLHHILLAESGVLRAECAGRLRHEASGRDELPAAGDWVAASQADASGPAVIHAVLPRKSRFVRQASGARTEQQVIAANVDTVFIVMGLDGDFNLRRIERYLTAAWDSGARPVALLNKADLCPDPQERVEQVQEVAFGVDVYAVSAQARQGLAQLAPYLTAGATVALLGSSGVGKSSLVNALLGEERQRVHDVRADDSRGRHTTTSRTLLPLPDGALLLDTPGMRELQLWSSEGALERTFRDVEALAEQCRFRDCQHGCEPGCAVQEALATGELAEKRWRSYLKLQRELAFQARRADANLDRIERERWKKIAVDHRKRTKARKRIEGPWP